MISAEELRNLLAEFRQQNRDDIAAKQDVIRQLTLAVSNLAANVGAVPGAAPTVLLQTVRKSSERWFSGKLLEKRRVARQQRRDDAAATNDAIRAMAATVGRLMQKLGRW